MKEEEEEGAKASERRRAEELEEQDGGVRGREKEREKVKEGGCAEVERNGG